MKANLEVEILKILLSKPHRTDISVRQIAKKLDRPSSHVFYYLKKMTEQGILTKEEVGDKGYYKPQAIFGRDVNRTMKLLDEVAENIEDSTDEAVTNCIRLFLKLWRNEWCPKHL